MKVFVNGFWKGFLEGTDPVSVSVFLELLTYVFNEKVECGTFEESDVLLESLFLSKTCLMNKSWKYSFLFSGESRILPFYDKYTCVLYGVKNQQNIINCPLYVFYLHSSQKIHSIENLEPCIEVPRKSVCAIISNPHGAVRNKFLQALEKFMPIDYAGKYKTNVQIIDAPYNTEEFLNFIKQYKFVISMENSILDTYITEKITHGMLASTIPVYWGSPNANQYFNKNRFLQLKDDSDEEIDRVIQKMLFLSKNDNFYLNIVNQPIFANQTNQMVRTIYDIGNEIKTMLHLH